MSLNPKGVPFMKKLLIFLLALTLVLTACSNGAQTDIPPESKPEVSEKTETNEEQKTPESTESAEKTEEPKPAEKPENTETAEPQITDGVSYKDENGKFGFQKNGTPITEAIFDEITVITKIDADKGAMVFTESESADIIYAGIVTDGTRKEVELDWEKGAQLTEAPNILYTLYQAGDDFVINETPLSKFGFFEPGSYGNALADNLIIGVHEGDYYEYQQNKDKSWKLRTKDSGGVYYAYNEDFYFTQYHWNLFELRHGLVAPDGKTILEPIYADQPKRINDYFIVYDGYPSIHPDDIVRTLIIDKKGNIINDEYNFVTVTSWDGKFLLTATKIDEKGRRKEWFIDPNGKKLSESYDQIDLVTTVDSRGRVYYNSAEVLPDNENFNPYAETEIIPTEVFVQYYN